MPDPAPITGPTRHSRAVTHSIPAVALALCALTLSVSCTAAPLSATAAGGQGQGIANRSLELDGNHDGVPDCFQFDTWGTNTASARRDTGAHTGTSAERVTLSNFTSGDAKLLPAFTADCAPTVTTGTRYQASIWYRSSAPVTMVVFAHQSTGWTFWTEAGRFPANARYAAATSVLPAIPDGVTAISFGLALSQNGSVVSDDYSLQDGAAALGASPACPTGAVALTFDDGPDQYTAQLLDVLRDRHARATFFLIGQKITEATRPLVAREAREGHVVGDHTWTHPRLTQLPDSTITDELTRTSAAIVTAGAPKPTLYRPPYGDTNDHVGQLAASLGLTETVWSGDTNDWTGITVEETVNRALAAAVPGGVVLMHDRIANTVAAVPAILDGLHQRGLCTGVVTPTNRYDTALNAFIRVTT